MSVVESSSNERFWMIENKKHFTISVIMVGRVNTEIFVDFLAGSVLPPGLAKVHRTANMWTGGNTHCVLM